MLLFGQNGNQRFFDSQKIQKKTRIRGSLMPNWRFVNSQNFQEPKPQRRGWGGDLISMGLSLLEKRDITPIP
jgi:hypothetical protein